MLINEMIQELKLPWQHDEIKWRVGAMTKKKDKAKPLAYIDARTVMERLDSVVGAENWQDRYEFHGSRTMCYLSIRIDDEWVCKADGAGDSDIEGEKGAISDAFKRASVKWGMGRELYELKTRWMPVDEWKKLVGDPWDFVIKSNSPTTAKKKAVIDTPKETPKKVEKTEEQKRAEAVTWTDNYMKELIKCRDGRDIMNLEHTDKNSIWLQAMRKRHPDLSTKIDAKLKEVQGGFVLSPSQAAAQ